MSYQQVLVILKVRFTALLSLLSRLLCTPALCLRTSQIVPYLLGMKVKGTYGTCFKILKGLLYVYQLALLLRAVAFNIYLIKDGDITAYLTVDPLLSLAALQIGIFNKYTVAIGGLLALFFIYLDVTYFFYLDIPILKGTQEILIENVAQCSTAGHGPVGAPPHHSLRHWVRSIGELTQFQKSDLNLGRRRRLVAFRGRNLKVFPHLSVKHRAYLVLMVIYSETVVWACNLCAGVFFLFICCLELCVIFHLVPPLLLPFALIDLLILFYSAFNSFRTVLFALHGISLFRCMFSGHLKELQAKLMTALEKAKAVQGSIRERGRIITLMGQLAFFATEHRRIHHFEEHLNQHGGSHLMLVTVIIHVLLNVVALNFLLISHTTLLEMSLVLITTLLQTFLGLLCTQIFLSMVAQLYTSERLLYRAQGNLRGSSTSFTEIYVWQVLSAKLRLMTLFELICTKKKFAFTIGSISKVTKKSVFEFFFGYSCFFLFIAKLLRTHQIQL